MKTHRKINFSVGFLSNFRMQKDFNYLRLSITDRCNLRCIYCRSSNLKLINKKDILPYEDIEKIVRVSVDLGIDRIRITGGEPLLRDDVIKLIRILSKIKGISDLSLTTNGILLGKYFSLLKDSGIKRVNISLDTLNSEKYNKITGGNNLKQVLHNIEKAAEIFSVKINVVVMRGINDDELPIFINRLSQGVYVRFIELMPISIENYKYIFLSRDEIIKKLNEFFYVEEIKKNNNVIGAGPARYYKVMNNGKSSIVGIISPMTDSEFCKECNRLRLTADGFIKPCLTSNFKIYIKNITSNYKKLKEAFINAFWYKLNHKKEEKSFYNIKSLSNIGG